MAVPIEVNYRQSPLYNEAMRNFQLGNWDAGLTQLSELMECYPLEHDLRSLRQEMQIRSKVDQDESVDQKNKKKQFLIGWAIRIAAIYIVLGLIYWGARSYSSWIQQRWDTTQNTLSNEVQKLDLTVRFNNGANYLKAGRPEEAKSIFLEIVKTNPDYPEINNFIAQADAQIQIESDYLKAVQLLNDGKQAEALAAFTTVAAQDPNYKDVSMQLQNLKRTTELEDLFNQADQAYREQRWVDVINDLEQLQTINKEYLTDAVEERLYNSYILAAEEALKDPVETLEALQRAESYYSKALALRPRDPDLLAKRAQARTAVEGRMVQSYIAAAQAALNGQADSIKALQKAEDYLNKASAMKPGDPKVEVQVQMTRRYLSALDAFTKVNYDQVISDLEFVCSQDPSYADGTARQTLYEAYVGRGNNRLASGDFDLALKDFQQAAVFAQQAPDSLLRLFEAQILIADTQGLLGNYKEAVLLYQAAANLGGLSEIARSKKTQVADTLTKAETLSANGEYKNAYQAYSSALHDIKELYAGQNVVVKNGDYLTMLARRYNSTVAAILAANGINRASDLKDNMILFIPTLP